MIGRRMSPLAYRCAQKFITYARRQCLQTRTLHLERLQCNAPFIIACTHFSHLEPFLLSSLVKPPIRWVARSEMYRLRAAAKILDWSGAIRIRRQSRSVRAIHQSIEALADGCILGIFPEGGVTHGRGAIVRGGPVKHGVSLIALRARVPIVPVIMMGAHKLNAVEPWLPGSRTPLAVAVGRPIYPPVLPAGASIGVRRQARLRMSEQLAAEFVRQYQEALRHFAIDDRKNP